MKIDNAQEFVKKFIQFNYVQGFSNRTVQQDVLDDLYSAAIIIQFSNKDRDPELSREDLFMNNFISWFEDQDFERMKKKEQVFKSLELLVNRVDLRWVSYLREAYKLKASLKTVQVKRKTPKKISRYS
jgi:hypothetical protein